MTWKCQNRNSFMTDGTKRKKRENGSSAKSQTPDLVAGSKPTQSVSGAEH